MEQRRFLAINFWVGIRTEGYPVGPVLVSTSDYERFHFWDEPSAALLGADEYEIIKLYPRGLTYDEVTRQYAKDFPLAATEPYHSSGWMARDGAASWLEAWVGRRQLHVIAA